MITTFTIDALIDAGLSAEAFKTIKAAFDLDIENARNDVREHIVTADAGSATPAAVRMRKMREKRRLLEVFGSSEPTPNTANSVTEQSVTSYNNLSLEEVLKKEEIKKERKTVKRNSYTEKFELFWKPYPTDPLMSKLEAFKAFEKLSAEDQDRAITAIPAFRESIPKQGPNYRVLHAVRFLSQRRFDGFQSLQATFSKQPFIEEGSEAWKQWSEHLGKSPQAFEVRRNGRIVRGRQFPTEYPPLREAAA